MGRKQNKQKVVKIIKKKFEKYHVPDTGSYLGVPPGCFFSGLEVQMYFSHRFYGFSLSEVSMCLSKAPVQVLLLCSVNYYLNVVDFWC